MKIQVLEDNQGNKSGIFIPMEDWALIKSNYPDIESLDQEIPDWHKNILNERLETIQKDPKQLKPINELLEELDKEL